jgi:DNA-binding NarL/FixJ family response regulator
MSNRRVLVVDDHELVRRGLKDMLRDTGFDVCGEAENGQQGVDQTLKLKPDLVLLDMSMPVMTGLQAAAAIRRLAPATKIIMVSMHDSPQMVKEARAAGADAYITKTSAGKELLATMYRLFELGAGQSS